MAAPKGNKYALGNRGGMKGRSGAPKYRPQHAERALLATRAGFTDEELAGLFEVSVVTLNKWKIDHDEFASALKIGKGVPDDRIEQSLYRRGIAGDVTACIFWLKNRRPAEWRDKREESHDGSVSLTITRVKADEPKE